jgi:hypothetical protein
MADRETAAPVTIEELLILTLAQTDALAKRLIEKGIITRNTCVKPTQGGFNHWRQALGDPFDGAENQTVLR